MDYSKYKPGIYLQMGDQLTPVTSSKSASFLAAFGASGGGATGAEALAEKVAWVYIALQKRRELILEIELAQRCITLTRFRGRYPPTPWGLNKGQEVTLTLQKSRMLQIQA